LSSHGVIIVAAGGLNHVKADNQAHNQNRTSYI
jgi:hypothetical protein